MARELKKTHPDKYLSIFPYSDYAYYPETIDVEKQRVALFDQAVWQYMVEGRRRWEEKGK